MAKKHSALEAGLILGGVVLLGVIVYKKMSAPSVSTSSGLTEPTSSPIPGANPNSDDPNLAPVNQT